MMKYMIGRCKAGKLHNMLGQRSAACNGRGSLVLSLVSVETVQAAHESLFCSKCFRDGKESRLVELYIEQGK